MDARVVIAGGGPAASAAALSLCALGIQPVLLVKSIRTPPGFEAIFEPAFPLMDELGLTAAARKAGAVISEGFSVVWENEDRVRPGQWLCVDRAAFADAAMALAVERGAEIRSCSALPPLTPVHEAVGVCLADRQQVFAAAIDATGRSAVWSGAIERRGYAVADLFHACAEATRQPLVQKLTHESWFYALGCTAQRTIGVIQERPRSLNVHSSTEALPEHLGRLKFLRRCPAFPQWAGVPISGRRIAIGDALLAHAPLAGNGIHFALTTAKLGAQVAASWIRRTAGYERSADFYSEMACSARVRHLSAMQAFRKGKDRVGNISANEHFRFAASVHAQTLNMNGRFEENEAICLPDGGTVRWLSGLDLLHLRTLAKEPMSPPELVNRWSHAGVSRARVEAVIEWCIAHQILEVCG